ncbi:ARM repeat superfamily protein, putative isoform 2 [Hibiscus syriacus]|uniref:ARM repeat superfamily protein, putative isoform 2 n=1 Tax=Hibiscus syriacus TaxID=106335 RepID=A0A6A3B5J7_HIBSY|nr:ARM repeat superfamily protein, putative isoform 2 [Hibiscus syriacus]
MLESQKEVEHTLLSRLMKLGLASLLVNLLAFEMSKLMNDRIPDSCLMASNALKWDSKFSSSSDDPVLDVILRALEALCVIDVSTSCVTAEVLIANILSDVPDLASNISQDFPFLQGLFDIFPFTSDDSEARSALWSIIARLLVRVREDEMSTSSLHQIVFILLSNSDVIEDDLFDQQFDENKDFESLATSGRKSDARTPALRRIICILNKWNALRDSFEKDMIEEHVTDEKICRLLGICHKHTV